MQRQDTDHIRERLQGIWSEVLEMPRERIPFERNFFTIGGDSILIMQVMDRVNSEFFAGAPDGGLPLADFFTFATLRELTNRLAANVNANAISPPLPAATAGEIHSGAIALIGMAGRFPGAADPETFWRNLRDGVETLRFFSEEQLIEGGATAEDLADGRYVRCAGLVDDVQSFDAEFFGLTAVEASVMAPEQRLLLECAQQAMEAAGYGLRWRGERVGVFAGCGLSTYLLDHLVASSRALESASGMRLLLSNTSPATRISYLLNLSGPSITIDTACSSSLVAVHQACRSILSGECELALAGGATVRRFAPRGYRAEEGGIFSPDGHCRPFDRQAQGTVATSGAGMVLLKRLDAALADGDSIYAVIRGTAINNDGNAKVGYTAPSMTGQAAAIRAACAAAGVDPRSIRYVESHGTATALGDMIEIAALNHVFGSDGGPARCALGTLKANVGHLEAAAGVAGLMKVALALKHREIPPAIHFRDPNPQIDFEQTPFYLNRELEPWLSSSTPRRAGVSSFGIGGTNAHAILEEVPERDPTRSHRDSQLLILSARSPAALQTRSAQLAARMTAEPQLPLADVAYTLQIGHAAHPIRRFCVCEGIADAVSSMQAQVDPNDWEELSAADGTPVVFMFPGQGAQHLHMARGIYESEPVFREHLGQCAELLRLTCATDVREILYPPDVPGSEGRAADAATSQLVLFAVEYALARLWQSWGVVPSIVIGQGPGEYVAACISGVFSLEDALLLVGARGRLEGLLPDEALAEFAAVLERVTMHEVGIPFAASLNGAIFNSGARLPAEYCLRHLGATAVSSRSMHSVAQGARKVLLEVGPGTALSACMLKVAGSCRHAVINSCRDPSDPEKDSAALMRAVGRVWQAGATVDWSLFNSRNASRRVALPTYPFERRRHWVERPGLRTATLGAAPPASPSGNRGPGSSSSRGASKRVSDWFYVPAWKQRATLARDGVQTFDRCVLFDDGTAFGEAAAQALARRSADVVRVRAGETYSQDATGFTLNPMEPAHYSKLMAALATSGAQIPSIVHAWRANPPAKERIAPDDSLALGFYSLLYLCQALEESYHGRALRLAVLTSDAHVILGEEQGRPHDAMLAACAQVIGREFTNIVCRSIDVSLAGTSLAQRAKLADMVVIEALGASCEPVVAYRGASCFVPTYERLAPVAHAPSLLRPGGTYLITGGLGGVGLTLAQFLARSAAVRIVLTSRSQFPAREHWDSWLAAHGEDEVSERIRKLRSIEAQGAQVMVVRADVTEADQMQCAVAQALERFGALHGVVHAAGVPGAGVIALKSGAMAGQVIAPKIKGTQVVLEAVKELDLDFFLSCSSIAAILAPAGQFDYCAANAFQDAFAHAYDRKGRTRFISINWDGWSEVGMALNMRAPGTPRPIRLDHGMSCEEGCEAFRLALESPRPQWIISTRELGSVLDGSAAIGAPSSARSAEPQEQSANRDGTRESSTTEEVLAQIWGDLLGVPEPGVNDDFFALGGDSLLAIQLSTHMESHFGTSISIRQLLGSPTIAGLASLLSNAGRGRNCSDRASQAVEVTC